MKAYLEGGLGLACIDYLTASYTPSMNPSRFNQLRWVLWIFYANILLVSFFLLNLTEVPPGESFSEMCVHLLKNTFEAVQG